MHVREQLPPATVAPELLHDQQGFGAATNASQSASTAFISSRCCWARSACRRASRSKVEGLHLIPVSRSKIAAACAAGLCATNSAAASCTAGEALPVAPNRSAASAGKRPC